LFFSLEREFFGPCNRHFQVLKYTFLIKQNQINLFQDNLLRKKLRLALWFTSLIRIKYMILMFRKWL
jgi:hypothetical protein